MLKNEQRSLNTQCQQEYINQNPSSQIKVSLDKNAWRNSETNKLIMQQDHSKRTQSCTTKEKSIEVHVEKNEIGLFQKLKIIFSRKRSSNEDTKVEKKYKHRRKKNQSPQMKLSEQNPVNIKHDKSYFEEKGSSLESLKHHTKDLPEENYFNPYEKSLASSESINSELITELIKSKLDHKINHELHKELEIFSCQLESIFNEKFRMFLKSYKNQRENRKKEKEERARKSSKDYKEKIISEVIKQLINKETLRPIEITNPPKSKFEERFGRHRQLNCDTVLILSILPTTSTEIQTKNNKYSRRSSFFENLRKKSLYRPPKPKYEEVTVILPPKKFRNTQYINTQKIIPNQTNDHHNSREDSRISNNYRNVSGISENLDKLLELREKNSQPQKKGLSLVESKKVSPVTSQIDESFLTRLSSLNDYLCQSRTSSGLNNENLPNTDGVPLRDTDVYNGNGKRRLNENKYGQDSGIDFVVPKLDTCRNKSTANQNCTKPGAVQAGRTSQTNTDPAFKAFRSERNIVVAPSCQNEPSKNMQKSEIEDNIQKQFNGIFESINVIQQLYSKATATEASSSEHFSGIYETINSLTNLANDIKKPINTETGTGFTSQKKDNQKTEDGTSQMKKREIPVLSLTQNAEVDLGIEDISAKDNVVKQLTKPSKIQHFTTKPLNLEENTNGTIPKKEVYYCPQALKPPSQEFSTIIHQESEKNNNEEFKKPVTTEKSKSMLELNVFQKFGLKKSKSDICCAGNFKTKISIDVVGKTNVNRMCYLAPQPGVKSKLYSKNFSIAGELSAYEKRKQYDRELRQKMLKKKIKMSNKEEIENSMHEVEIS